MSATAAHLSLWQRWGWFSGSAEPQLTPRVFDELEISPDDKKFSQPNFSILGYEKLEVGLIFEPKE